MNFSFALIARNESKTLPRLIASLKEYQDRGGEIFILDTGSTDGTAEIARSLGCVVHEVGDRFVKTIDEKKADEINQRFAQKDEAPLVKAGDTLFDYASARNHIADLATTDFIFTPDCDEIWTTFNIDKVQEVIESGVEQLEYNFVFSHDEFGNEAIKFMHSKAYDRRKLKWKGIIHEVLDGNAVRQFLGEEHLKLEHWQNPETNRTHYLKGLALDCFENPDNDRNSHYLGRELLWTGRPHSAIKELMRHIQMDRWQPEKAQSAIFIGDAYGMLGEEEFQVSWYHAAMYFDGSRREAPIKLAEHYYKKKDAQRTASYVAHALEIGESNYYANQQAHYGAWPHEMMYWAKWQLKDYKGSEEHWKKALGLQPNHPKYLADSKFYMKHPKVSIIIPQLGRPMGLKRCLESIEKLSYPQEMIEVIVEDGDETVPIKVKQGFEKSTGEYIAFAANDMEFDPDAIAIAVTESKVNKKGLVAFDTGVRNKEGYICEHFLIHRDLVEKIGEIFDTEFHHVGVDDLLWKKCEKLGEAMVGQGKVIHHHFSRIGSGNKKDSIIEKGWQNEKEDRELLEKKLKAL